MTKDNPMTGAKAIRAAQRRGDLPKDFYFDPEMEKRKIKLANSYGIEPTITYYYFLRNVVDYAGEERVRQSFESVKDLNVIVGEYGSEDKTREIAEEYGFKVVTVEKTPGIEFHESKVVNKVTCETKTNFMANLNIHVEYPKNIDNFCKNWVRKNDITKKQLWLMARLVDGNGRIKKVYGGPILIYRPFLILTRGHDERTYYGFGDSYYTSYLLKDVLQLFTDTHDLDIKHKSHGHIKWARMRKMFPGLGNSVRRWKGNQLARQLIDDLKKDFDTAVKKVVNSYW